MLVHNTNKRTKPRGSDSEVARNTSACNEARVRKEKRGERRVTVARVPGRTVKLDEENANNALRKDGEMIVKAIVL
jgi:hypothetical protein